VRVGINDLGRLGLAWPGLAWLGPGLVLVLELELELAPVLVWAWSDSGWCWRWHWSLRRNRRCAPACLMLAWLRVV
jgi:hypothetical protein